MSVTQDQINKAKARTWPGSTTRMVNVDLLAVACDEYKFPFWLALAIMEKETHGRNIYGNDVGGALAGFKPDCNEGNYQVFRWLVDTQGMKSNGVGPFQVTWKGFFTNVNKTGMHDLLMDPYRPRDNIFYAIGKILKPSWDANRKKSSTLEQAFYAVAKAYNGKDSYAADAVAKAKQWFTIVGNADDPTVKF